MELPAAGDPGLMSWTTICSHASTPPHMQRTCRSKCVGTGLRAAPLLPAGRLPPPAPPPTPTPGLVPHTCGGSVVVVAPHARESQPWPRGSQWRSAWWHGKQWPTGARGCASVCTYLCPPASPTCPVAGSGAKVRPMGLSRTTRYSRRLMNTSPGWRKTVLCLQQLRQRASRLITYHTTRSQDTVDWHGVSCVTR